MKVIQKQEIVKWSFILPIKDTQSPSPQRENNYENSSSFSIQIKALSSNNQIIILTTNYQKSNNLKPKPNRETRRPDQDLYITGL